MALDHTISFLLRLADNVAWQGCTPCHSQQSVRALVSSSTFHLMFNHHMWDRVITHLKLY